MLRDQLEKYLKSSSVVFQEEKDYIERNHMNVPNIIENGPNDRFIDAYIERCDKESEILIEKESFAFLMQPLDYLKKHKNEFIYLESNWFELIGVDAVSLEVDDVFGTFDVMLGLRLQKKFEKNIKDFLNTHLHSDEAKFDLMFSGDEGLWSLNFALNYVEGFQDIKSILEAYQLIYRFLFNLAQAMEG